MVNKILKPWESTAKEDVQGKKKNYPRILWISR